MHTLDPARYLELKAFYAGHMQVRDRGDTEGWLAAFTEDAALATNVFDQGAFARKDEFAPEVRELDRKFAAADVQRRHRLSNFVCRENPDGTIECTYYALLLTSTPDGGAKFHSTTVAHDVLRHTPEGYRVLARKVYRDDLAKKPAQEGDTR